MAVYIFLAIVFVVSWLFAAYMGGRVWEHTFLPDVYRVFKEQKKLPLPASGPLIECESIVRNAAKATAYQCKLFFYREGLLVKLYNPTPSPTNPTPRLFCPWGELSAGKTDVIPLATRFSLWGTFRRTMFTEMYYRDEPFVIFVPEDALAIFRRIQERQLKT